MTSDGSRLVVPATMHARDLGDVSPRSVVRILAGFKEQSARSRRARQAAGPGEVTCGGDD